MLPENWNAVDVFRNCDTQWKTVSVGLAGVFYEGLVYSEVTCVARDWLGLDPSRELLQQIRLMESVAKKILND